MLVALIYLQDFSKFQRLLGLKVLNFQGHSGTKCFLKDFLKAYVNH